MELKEVAEREKILLEQHLEQLKKRIRETKNHMDRIVNDIENSVQPITHKLNDEFLIALPDAKLYVSQVQNILSSLEGIMSKYSIQSNKVAKVPGGPVAFTPVLREKLPCDENKSLKKSFTSKTEERNVAPSSGLKMYESETKLANKRCKVRSNKSTSIVGGAEEELLENKISTQAEMYHISSQGVHEHEFYNEGRIPKVLAENNVYRSLETDFTDVFASQQCRDADALKGDLDILRPKLCACSNPGILPLKQPTHVIISLIKLPNLAWIQRSDCELPKLNEHLGFLLSTNNYTPYGNLYVGMKVAALYKQNRAYYRAIITGLADETSKVDDHALYAKDIPDPVFTSLQNYVYEGTILLAVIEKLPVPQSDSQYLRPLEYTARLYTPQYRLYRSEVEVHPYYWLYTSELGTGLQSDTSSDDVIEDVEILDEVLSEQSSSQGENNCTTEKQGSWTLLTENLKHCDCGHWTRLLMPANQKAARKYAVDSSIQVTRSKKNIEACFKDITCNSKSTTIG
ncbi:hypothetical protein SK128_008209 [Halocaridina rubra]|uniref:Uncharacterized protein n=1 Tax=Halocaridina rubra TaxID=373956 RepID=A0AAN8ZYK8_HALRR